MMEIDNIQESDRIYEEEPQDTECVNFLEEPTNSAYQ